MSQKFSERDRGQCSDRRIFASDNLGARWAAYSSRILPAGWPAESVRTAEFLFYTGAAMAFDLLVMTPSRHSPAESDAAARRIFQDLQVWLKKRQKESRVRSHA